MRWPIRRQIMFPLLAVAIVGLSAVGVINAVLVERRTCDQVEQQLRQVVRVLSSSSFPLTNSVLQQMRDLSGAEFVLVDDSGEAAASTLPGTTAASRTEGCFADSGRAIGAVGGSGRTVVLSYAGEAAD